MIAVSAPFPEGPIVYGLMHPGSREIGYVGSTCCLHKRMVAHYHKRPFLRKFHVVIIRTRPRDLLVTEHRIIQAFKRRHQCGLNSNKRFYEPVRRIYPPSPGSCPQCSNPMPPKRAGAVFCSDACRIKAHRKRHKDLNAKRGRPRKQQTTNSKP